MACNPNIVGEIGMPEIKHAIPGNLRRFASGSPSELTIRRVSWNSLAVVELSLLAILAMVFTIAVLVTPEFQVKAFGIDLPEFFACPFLTVTGIPCLFCGMTRSFMAMGNLDIVQAFIFHPLGPFIFSGLAGLGAILTASVLTRRRIHFSLSRRLQHGLVTWGGIILLLAWVIKIIVWRQAGLL